MKAYDEICEGCRHWRGSMACMHPKLERKYPRKGYGEFGRFMWMADARHESGPCGPNAALFEAKEGA